MQVGCYLVYCLVVVFYVEKLVVCVKVLYVGDLYWGQVYLGLLINVCQCDCLYGLVMQSIVVGVILFVGGYYDELFYVFIVLVGVIFEMLVYYEELFGFVVLIIVFDDECQVIVLVNGSFYGLVVVVYSCDVVCVMVLGCQLCCGMVYINDQMVNNEFQVFFGGMGDFGNVSCFGGLVSVYEFI